MEEIIKEICNELQGEGEDFANFVLEFIYSLKNTQN